MVDQVLSFLIPLVATAILLEPFKRFQRKYKIGQYIRQEGPDLHNYKTGTPTASGVIFIPISLIVMILFSRQPETLIVVSAGILFGAVGLIDDISKIAKKNAAGLSGKRKLLLQFVFASIVVLMIQLYNPHTSMKIPFGGEIEFGFLYYIISAIVLAGMSNAVNLSDGIDGLAGSMFIFSLIPLFALPLWQNGIIAPICGALAGFLWHNWFPASVFMGDTGALGLGGMLATVFAIEGREIFLIFFGVMFIIEMFSVILQVGSFKLFGRRVFRMSPIHHHFELKGWKETKITFRFSLLALTAAVVGLLAW